MYTKRRSEHSFPANGAPFRKVNCGFGFFLSLSCVKFSFFLVVLKNSIDLLFIFFIKQMIIVIIIIIKFSHGLVEFDKLLTSKIIFTGRRRARTFFSIH